MRTPSLLEFRDVTRHWSAGLLGGPPSRVALDGVSVRVREGELVAVTGAAGSGKSTLLLIAAAAVRPTAGQVRWAGRDDARALRPQLLRARPWEYHFLTVRQALAYHAAVLAVGDGPRPAPTRYLPLMHRVGLVGVARMPLGALGPLDQLRVVIAQGLLAAPGLLCLDEPFAFCGPAERREGARLLRQLAGSGLGVLVAGRDVEACGGATGLDQWWPLAAGRLSEGAATSRNVLELSVPQPDDAMRRLLPRLPSVARRGRRLRVPLFDGTSPEAVLALCRDAGVAVRASRVAEERVAEARVAQERAAVEREAEARAADVRVAAQPLPPKSASR